MISHPKKRQVDDKDFEKGHADDKSLEKERGDDNSVESNQCFDSRCDDCVIHAALPKLTALSLVKCKLNILSVIGRTACLNSLRALCLAENKGENLIRLDLMGVHWTVEAFIAFWRSAHRRSWPGGAEFCLQKLGVFRTMQISPKTDFSFYFQ
jgi:hypothetical protein